MDFRNIFKSIIDISFFVPFTNKHSNTSLPYEFSSASLFSDSYISPLLLAYTYHNVGSNERDLLFCPFCIVQRICSISMVFVYPLPLTESSCNNIVIISSIRLFLYSIGILSILQYFLSASGIIITASFNTRLYSI